MKQKIEDLLKQAKQIMGDGADFIIVAHKDGQCGATIHGGTDKVAEAIFSCMHQPNNPIGPVLYHIIKSNVLNILSNPSPFANNLIDQIEKILPDDE